MNEEQKKARTEDSHDIMLAVERILDVGHMNTEDLARLRRAWEAASPAPASLPPQGAASPDPQLLKFYAVSDYPSLVAAMLRHIEKLQSKLPKDGQPLLTRVRA